MRTQNFVHLNVHSHYSINDGCASIKELVDAAIKEKMPGVAITDNGNMFGVMEFFDYVSRINNERRQKGKKPFKPIIGCELYVAPGAKEDKKLTKNACADFKEVIDNGYENIPLFNNALHSHIYCRSARVRIFTCRLRVGPCTRFISKYWDIVCCDVPFF